MQINKLALNTNNIDSQVAFFKDILGFEVEHKVDLISITIGTSTLEFVNTPVDGKYHYCFLIPCNQIDKAKEWLSNKIDLIPVEDNNFIAYFEFWNAHSIYFYDGDGNIAELIARHDLQNDSDKEFGIHSFLSVNEIGMPSSDIRSLDTYLTNEIGSIYWKGDRDRFSANGDQHGLFLLPNFNIKKTWYPTEIEVLPLPYTATIIQDGKVYDVSYENEVMRIDSIR